MPRTPMPHSERRFPPRKPVIPSTTSPRSATARYTALPPTSEPRPNERQRQALRAAKTAVAAKAVYWWGSIAATKVDSSSYGRCAISPVTVAAIAPIIPSISNSQAGLCRFGLLSKAKRSSPTLTKRNAIGKWFIAPWAWLTRFSKVKKFASILLFSLADGRGGGTDSEDESATKEMRLHPFLGMSRKVHKFGSLFCFNDAVITENPRGVLLGNW